MASLLVVGCSDGNDSARSEPEPPKPSTEPTVIWNEGSDLSTSDWSTFVIIKGETLGDTPKTIVVTYDASYTDYISLKIAGNYSGLSLGDGEIVGASLKAGDKGALENLAPNGTTNATFEYTPTESEWASIKTGKTGDTDNGFYLNGHGAIIKTIALK